MREVMEITFHHDPIRFIIPRTVEDETWRYVDRKGHLHRWKKTKAGRFYHTSVKWVRTGTYVDEDGEKRPVGRWKCRWCRERVEPRWCANYERQYLPGPKRLTGTFEVQPGETLRVGDKFNLNTLTLPAKWGCGAADGLCGFGLITGHKVDMTSRTPETMDFDARKFSSKRRCQTCKRRKPHSAFTGPMSFKGRLTLNCSNCRRRKRHA